MKKSLKIVGIMLVALFILAGAARAKPAPCHAVASTGGIEVFGRAEIAAQPDIILLNFGVFAHSIVPSAASKENALICQRILAALDELGIKESDIMTVGYNLFPNYDYNSTLRNIKSYTVQKDLQLRITDIELAGKIADTLQREGAATISGLSFLVSNHSVLYNEALKAALNDASQKAQLIAQEMGEGKTARLVDFVERGNDRVTYLERSAQSLAVDLSTTSFEAGLFSVTATINARFEIVNA